MEDRRLGKKDVIITEQTDKSSNRRALHILITGRCNSSCAFCFTREELKEIHFPYSLISEIIKDYYGKGYRIIVLSGGEPTIHPDFLEIVKSAKSTGYEHVKVISNGRMFYYRGFLEQAIKAGLDEAVISVHSHLPSVQDSFAGFKGGFEQTLRGIKNCLQYGLKIRINIVVNNKNVKNLKYSIAFFKDIGVKKIGLLRIMPFGRAWKNKSYLFPNNSRNIKYLIEALETAKRKNVEIGANRFDLKIFKHYPEFMQDPFKFVNEVEARLTEFNNLATKGKELFCYPERCKYCFLEDFCRELHSVCKKTAAKNLNYENLSYIDNNPINPLKFAERYSRRFKNGKI